VTGPTPVEPPVVLVTGATGGIGAETVRAYARRGARLVLLARSAAALERLAAEVATLPGQEDAPAALVAVADVADAEAVEKAVTTAVEQFGGLDVVVHTAAVVAYGRLPEVPPSVWDRVLSVGIGGTSNVARSALAVLERQAAAGRPGHLVVVGSILGRTTAPYIGSYVTSKFAVHGLVRVLQQEARLTPGVHVSMVEPGSIDTQIYALSGSYSGRVGKPPPPVASPARVADAVLAVVDRDRRSASVGIANPLIRFGFAATPWLYDRLVGPLMRAFGQGSPTPHRDGNVFTPSDEVT
jgi:NAD(P)-dependent dehydrogenase (short-subunit alcohol dehydrogenase family)